eukprot:SAG22_NODE_9972_length_560_cov_1.496746_1_plen_84_part_10
MQTAGARRTSAALCKQCTARSGRTARVVELLGRAERQARGVREQLPRRDRARARRSPTHRSPARRSRSSQATMATMATGVGPNR